MSNQRYRTGIENVPLREINKHCPIIVTLISVATDDVIETIELDYAKVEDRKHLGKLTFWAVSNGHSVETMAKKDADKEYEVNNDKEC